MQFTKKLLFIALFIAIAFSQCDGEDGETRYPIGNTCLTANEIAVCNDNLGDLDHKEEENDSITNICEPAFHNGQQVYDFTVQFIDFQPDLNCLEFEVGFENHILNDGEASLNEWKYDGENRNIVFTVSHNDMENLYNCEFIADDDQYTWICDMYVSILFAGEEQLRYEFQIQVTLGRSTSADTNADGENLSVNVVKNTVQGICCENELNIETALRFCTDFTCTDYEDNPFSIQRGQEFVVEHYIVSPEFQKYYLEGKRIMLGPFFPTVVDSNGANKGRYIWKIKSNIAMDDLVIESISDISNVGPIRLRRVLQELRDDYKVKATSTMSIVTVSTNEEQEKQEENKQVIIEKVNESSDDNVLMIALISVGGLVLISMIGGAAYYFKSKKKPTSEPKYVVTEQDQDQE